MMSEDVAIEMRKALDHFISPREILGRLAEVLKHTEPWTQQNLENSARYFAFSAGLKFSYVCELIRIAMLGENRPFPTYTLLEVVGQDKSLLRLRGRERGQAVNGTAST